MSKHIQSSKGQIDRTGEVMTREKLVPLFDDIKSLIVSTAKGTETSLRKDIQRIENELQLTQKALRSTKDELNTKIDGVETRLCGEIKRTETRLRGEIKDTETRLRGEIKDTEGRLTDKIESIHGRVDTHEIRISTIESARA